jgi:hypothetical protein
MAKIKTKSIQYLRKQLQRRESKLVELHFAVSFLKAELDRELDTIAATLEDLEGYED